MNTLVIGQQGEDIAVQFLREHGYAIHGRNIRLGRDEIDIVAYDREERCLVFVEVKRRSAYDEDFLPHLALTRAKKKKLKRSAWKWMHLHAYDAPWRIDAVLIIGTRIFRHIKQL